MPKSCPFDMITIAFCSISRGEAEKHGFGAPFPGPFFRAGSAGRSAAFFLVSGHVFSSFPASEPGRFSSLPAMICVVSGLQAGAFFFRFRPRFF